MDKEGKMEVCCCCGHVFNNGEGRYRYKCEPYCDYCWPNKEPEALKFLWEKKGSAEEKPQYYQLSQQRSSPELFYA